jgi:formylglycine-generating enzyme required for sulfatase activity
MRQLMIVILLLGWVSVGNANEEITVELADGATMEMVWIEPGTSTLGEPEPCDDYFCPVPQHQVTFSQGFWLGKYEITQGQWEAVTGTVPWKGADRVHELPDHPATYISWDDVQTLIHALNEAAGDSLYRLPTEAEWEYACRAGTATRWSFGDDESQLGENAWYKGNVALPGLLPQRVGSKLPNPWGLHDMHGNAYEWCQDLYEGGSTSGESGSTGPPPGTRVLRGGASFSSADHTRSAYRIAIAPDQFHYTGGARLLMMERELTNVTPESWGQIKVDP